MGMNIRKSYDSELHQVKMSIVDMGSKVGEALTEVLAAFQTNDKEQLDAVIKNDDKINQLELAINDTVTLMIAKQQPVATDLRTLIVALKMASDLERIADLAVDLAKTSKRLERSKGHEEWYKQLYAIGEDTKVMYSRALDGYEQGDVLQAQKIAALDDHVDQKYGEFIKGLFFQSTEPQQTKEMVHLAFIGRYLERIADYATNIAEWIVYEANGQHFDLN
ncbi:phosphate signaling complex protein PhoU [Desertibacillus haloalkaliphilus]|uniref:phosphate signaling complex protein PhoU n=1 Tax=Desertibacillus haloalkaliphilus TaxID=1328930 RepID=UPI001FEA2B75|nr:phosphate signaling complex protein PhoU [Desertibacillus haloalkaliphilus]